MKRITDQDPESKSPDLVAENIARLKALFPEIVTEGPAGAAINVDVLKALVGDATVTDAEEKYGLNWHGKRRARQLALTPSLGTLRPCPEESVDWDTTQNLMIEGDNLEVLKLLQKSYAGKVKLIYIDPPYNTGKDFVYPDNFKDNIQNYLELTGQVEGGAKISSNTEANGRFHTEWLNMMYPRIVTSRSLLRQDGLMALSVDDAEIDNALKLMSDVFGEENRIGVLIRQTIEGGKQDSRTIQNIHEYCVCYAKDIDSIRLNKKLQTDFDHYTLVDEHFEERGKYYLKPLENGGLGYVPSLDYAIQGPDGEDIYPGGIHGDNGYRWVWGREKYDKAKELGMIQFVKARNGEGYKVYYKTYEKADTDGSPIERSTPFKSLYLDGFTNRQSINDLKRLFDGERVFDYTKPLSFLREIVAFGSDADSIVMDFFAGSGALGEAVLQANAQDDGNRKYILVQLPEPINESESHQRVAGKLCNQLGLAPNIAELTKERLRRAARKIRDENPLFAGDLGFRVFKLDSTNIREWSPDRDNIPDSLVDSIDHLKTNRTEADILYEVLLKLGLDLCVPIVKRTLAGKDVHSVGGGVLIACLATRIARADVEALGLGIVAWRKELATAGETTCLFRDSAFEDDVAKTNLAAILEQNGITTVRSL